MIFFLMLGMIVMINATPVWYQDPVVQDGWDYGSPLDAGDLTYFCHHKMDGCVPAPHNSTHFVQFYPVNGVKGEYWISMKMNISGDFTTEPKDYKLEVLNFEVQRIIGPPYPVTFWEGPWFASFIVVVDDFWFSEPISLVSYPDFQRTTLELYFYNVTGVPEYLDIQYFTENSVDTTARVTFSGLRLYWI